MGAGGDTPRITVSVEAFTESIILGRTLQVAFRDRGYEVVDLITGDGDSQVCRDSLLTGAIDSSWEQTGTALSVCLEVETRRSSPSGGG